MTLTHAELLDIVIALDTEACRPECADSEKFLSLKWKVFALSVEAAKEEHADADDWRAQTGHDCTNGGTEDLCDDCNPYLQ